MSYATDAEIQLAESLGYTWDVNQQRGHHFVKGQRHVWACAATPTCRAENNYGPLMAWQTADLIDNHYQSHLKFNDLSDALRRPL